MNSVNPCNQCGEKDGHKGDCPNIIKPFGGPSWP